MNKTSLEKILQHPDKDEIISKLIIGVSCKEVNDWLKNKYTNVSESKFVISEKLIKSFQDNYLDIYNILKDDFAKTKTAINSSTEQQLELSVRNNTVYKSKMIELASKEINIKDMIKNLCVAIETRLSQVFDAIQDDPNNINTRIDRLLIEYADTLGTLLEKYYKIVENGPDQIVQHNITLQAVDQHISVFHDVIKEVLSKMDIETSMYFMEVFNEKMSKLKMPSESHKVTTEERLIETQLISETINKKINESG